MLQVPKVQLTDLNSPAIQFRPRTVFVGNPRSTLPSSDRLWAPSSNLIHHRILHISSQQPSRTGSPRQLNTPPPSTARYQPPRPDFVCATLVHIFDLEPDTYQGVVIFDRHFNEKAWDPCELQPCPNRYNPYTPVIHEADRSWAIAINRSQDDYIQGHLQHIAQPVPQRLTFPPAGLSASGSQPPEPPEQPAQPPADPPAGSSSQENPLTSVVNPPKEPTPPPAQPSTHPSRNPSR
ncbi:hypothetical protein K435DRAFT_860211 [Dendrothele bispora CBS 962.96]|uniref:Uncharacterized protein n=1 Tax=Dendrothele bispora (strain CBS 962.96) TaxID=1314807 RepID=A0A4S8LYG0_DENBC|nr:hypothetical protein K435DRAFT_860211 [Dendrothele bispora CBS 962.96]